MRTSWTQSKFRHACVQILMTPTPHTLHNTHHAPHPHTCCTYLTVAWLQANRSHHLYREIINNFSEMPTPSKVWSIFMKMIGILRMIRFQDSARVTKRNVCTPACCESKQQHHGIWKFEFARRHERYRAARVAISVDIYSFNLWMAESPSMT